MSCLSTGETMVDPITGADCGESVSSSKGFVETRRSDWPLADAKELAEGDRARFRKGLLEPRLTGAGPKACWTGEPVDEQQTDQG